MDPRRIWKWGMGQRSHPMIVTIKFSDSSLFDGVSSGLECGATAISVSSVSSRGQPPLVNLR